MPGRLKELIIASGYSGAPGQSFRNNVASASTGVSMTRYKMYGWTWSGDPGAGEYGSGTTFNMSITFTSQGDYAQYIKRTGAVLVITPGGGNPLGSSVTVNSQSVAAASTGSTLSVSVVGGFNPAAVASGDAWFDGYTKPNYPADGNPAVSTWQFYLSGASGGGSPQRVFFDVTYTPDSGGFNPATDYVRNFDVLVTNRPETIYDWDVEWYSDSGYTTLYTTGPSFWIYTSPGNNYVYYLRARRHGGSWTNYGAVSMFDPR